MRARHLFAFAALACLAVTSAFAVEGWERLGSRTVEFRGDSDTIPLGRFEGRFRNLMIEVTEGAIEMYNVRIVFGNGRTFSPPTRLVFDENTRSRAIDLPGARLIRSVTFNYRSIGGGRRAIVTLYGR